MRQGVSENYPFDFNRINDRLQNFGAVHSASELHGYFCGLHSGGKQFATQEWLDHATKFLDLECVGGLNHEGKALIEAFQQQAYEQLNDQNYVFTPLLPDDTASLTWRVKELGAWCQGFLHGVGSSGLKADQSLSADSAEVLRDFAEISQIDADFESGDLGSVADDPSAENDREAQLFELTEYIKTAVLGFRADQMGPTAVLDLAQQVRALSNGPSNDDTVH